MWCSCRPYWVFKKRSGKRTRLSALKQSWFSYQFYFWAGFEPNIFVLSDAAAYGYHSVGCNFQFWILDGFFCVLSFIIRRLYSLYKSNLTRTKPRIKNTPRKQCISATGSNPAKQLKKDLGSIAWFSTTSPACPTPPLPSDVPAVLSPCFHFL